MMRFGLSPRSAPAVVVLLAIAFAAMRGYGVLGPQNARVLLPLSFTVMGLLPWLLLEPGGRREIGLRKPNSMMFFIVAVAFGAIAPVAIHAIGYLLYGLSEDNWYRTIANYYKSSAPGLSGVPLMIACTIPAMVFSPVGEELFFRGVLPKTLEVAFSAGVARWTECGLFGLVHVVHHGLYVSDGSLSLRWASGGLWVALMVAVAHAFAEMRDRSESILVPIVAHSIFNLSMSIVIFRHYIE